MVKRRQRVDHRDLRTSAASSATVSCEPERITIACRYRDSTRAVSPIDSPRPSCSSSARSASGCPPSSATPTWNETRVRVEGRSKNSATVRPRERGRSESPFPARLQLDRPVEQRVELGGTELLAGQKVSRRPAQAGHSMAMELHAMTWNLFHGRDFPPDPELLSWRSRLLRITERGATHAQVNRTSASRVRRRCSRRRTGTSPCFRSRPPRWSTTLAGEAGAERPPCAHLAQLARRDPGARRAPQPGPDRLQRGRLEPDPGPWRDPRAPTSSSSARVPTPSVG